MKDCNQCGKCCVNYSDGGLSVTTTEVEYWEIFRTDISCYVNEGKIWMDPHTGKQLKLCPWLKQLPNQKMYRCEIYHDRPDECMSYPVTIDQMVKDECEMLETQDLNNRQKAQKTLDKIMSDSRPPIP